MEAYSWLKNRTSRMIKSSHQQQRQPNRPSKQQPQKQEVLDLIIISAQQLKTVTWFQRQQPYAVARIGPCGSAAERRTEVDTDASNPTWNAIVRFHVDAEVLELDTALLTVEVYSRGVLWDSLLGTVRIFLSDLVAKEECFLGKCLTFMVLRPSGRRQGLLNIGVPPKSFDLLRSCREGPVAMSMGEGKSDDILPNQMMAEDILQNQIGFVTESGTETESTTETETEFVVVTEESSLD